MANATFIRDGNILWLARVKVGNPSAWQPGYSYRLGDVVVPVSPQPGQENLMFQCVGFLGKSGTTQPVFGTDIESVTVDNEIEWVCRDPNASLSAKEYNQYLNIEQSVLVE